MKSQVGKSKESHFEIHEVLIDDKVVKNRIIEYLLPHEVDSLFLLANLKAPAFPSHYYSAEHQGKIIGVAAYFPPFKSCSLFTEDAHVAREFIHLLCSKHEISALLSAAVCGKVAYDEFLKLGYTSTHDPRRVFMELSLKDFHFVDSTVGQIRLAEEKDIEQIILLHRFLNRQSQNVPIQEKEKAKVRLNPVTFCLELDNKIVCTALSNGCVYKTFQILGVVTHPDYQKRGFAKAVCSHLIRHFQEKEGAEKVVLFTGYENTFAKACYQALGFRQKGDYYFAEFA